MRIRLAQILALVVVLLGLGTSAGAAGSRGHAPILGVVPHAGAFHPLSGFAAFNGSGPLVLQTQPCTLANTCWTMGTNTTYAIYWVPSGYSVDASYEADINRYFHDVAAASGNLSNVYSVAMQYYDNVAAIHYQSTFAGSYVDTDPFPANGCSAAAHCLTDSQLQQEIQTVLTREGWHGSTTNMFFLMTPDGVASCFDSSSQQCTTNAYCAYHSGFYDANGEPVIYANEPYDGSIPLCNIPAGQGTPNGADADATINTISHEHNEAITDPWGNAWIANDGNFGAPQDEIGDLCAWDFGAPVPFNQTINGDHYSLQPEYSNDGDACLLNYTPGVAPVDFTQPVLSGVAGQGRTLSTTEGSWQHAPNGYAYRWQQCAANGTGCADIAGAVAATYLLTAADAGHTIRSEVSAHNTAGTSSLVASAVTSAVVPLPSATASPVLSGVAAVRKQLSTTTGAWNNAVSFTYAWLRCAADGSGCVAIPGAAAAAYTAVAADAGHTLKARVSAANGAGTTAAVSNRTGVVIDVPGATKAPHISGRAKVGRKLSASKGTWSGPPTSYRFLWLRCNAHGGSCTRIHGAARSTYRLTKRDAGHRLRVRVTATDIAGSANVSSAASSRVPAARKH